MNGKRILGILVVMAMIATAMPVLAGHAKAANSNTNNVPSYLVVVRDIPEPHYVREINKTIGNEYQDSRFGVEVIAHVDDYGYYSKGPDEMHLEITGIGVRGSNAGDYKVKWFEIGSTKFSFEGKGSDTTPHATDYTSSVQAVANPYVGVGLRGQVHHQEVEWFKDISGAVAGTATSLAIDGLTDGAAGPFSGLIGTGAHDLVENAIDSMFNVNQKGINYKGSDPNPWSPTASYPHTFTLLRGVTDGSTDNPDKVLLSRSLQWNLYDGVNDRIHVLTLKATLDYAKYGRYYWGYGWYDEHKISTSVTIYTVPQSMAGSLTRGGNSDIEKYASDPANYNDYYLRVTTDTNSYSYYMPPLSSHTDTGDGSCVFLMSGVYNNMYFYYRGALPIGDNKDEYKLGFAKNANYDKNYANIWIYTSGDIRVIINYNGNTYTYTMKGGTSNDFLYKIPGSVNAYVTIEKLHADSIVSYWISGYYYGYNDYSGGSSGSGSSGGGGGSGGVPGHGSGGIHFTSAPPENPYTGDDTAPTSP